MKKRAMIISILFAAILLAAAAAQADSSASADAQGSAVNWAMKVDECVRIKDGDLTYSAGHYLAGDPLTLGYDPYGYNYQAHMFRGSYANVYLGRDGYPAYDGDDFAYLEENPTAENHWTWPFRNVNLLMKWNDAWLANADCGDDGLLDRHLGFESYVGSGAWLTNHMAGSEEDERRLSEALQGFAGAGG